MSKPLADAPAAFVLDFLLNERPLPAGSDWLIICEFAQLSPVGDVQALVRP